MKKMAKDYSWDYKDTYEWCKRAPEGHYPLVITVAINGGIQGKESNGALPETPEEIAQSAYEAYNAGASVIHIHGRDPDRLYDCTGEYGVYREINSRVREKCPGIIINNTTGGGPTTTMEQRYRCLEARPELASLNMGPDMSKFRIGARKPPLPHPREAMVFDECIPFTYGIIAKLAAVMKEKGIKPEMEMYHAGQYWVSQDLIEQGLIEPPYIFQFVMGYQTSPYPTPQNLLDMVRDLPKGSVFSVIGIGKYQWYMTTMGIILGGNVRVGLEDNVYLKRGRKLASNAEAVGKVVRIARELGREIATPAQAREILGVSPVPSSYEKV
jgi:3-keto-5-aminohexanoate cleavage enzyme